MTAPIVSRAQGNGLLPRENDKLVPSAPPIDGPFQSEEERRMFGVLWAKEFLPRFTIDFVVSETVELTLGDYYGV